MIVTWASIGMTPVVGSILAVRAMGMTAMAALREWTIP
jgi:hypothetical protein